MSAQPQYLASLAAASKWCAETSAWLSGRHWWQVATWAAERREIAQHLDVLSRTIEASRHLAAIAEYDLSQARLSLDEIVRNERESELNRKAEAIRRKLAMQAENVVQFRTRQKRAGHAL